MKHFNEYSKLVNRYKIFSLYDLDKGATTIPILMSAIVEFEKLEEYEACEGIRQAIEIFKKEMQLMKELEKDKPFVMLCNCASRQHQIIVEQFEDTNEVFCHIYLSHYGFWKRLWYGVRYIFGCKSQYGAWEEFMFDSRDADKLIELGLILKGK